MPLIDAVIFDMDGVLIDSEPFWRQAEVAALARVGVPITDDLARLTTGLRTDEVVEYWWARHPWQGPTRQEVASEIIRELIALVRTKGTAMPGAIETVDAIAAMDIPVGIASSSSSEVIAAVVERLNLGDRFRVLQSAEHEPYGKPHPAVYIEAARRLDASPARCVAIEDSPNGVIAAKAAKMRCIAVPDHELAGDHRIHAADAKLNSLQEFNPALFDGWLRTWFGS
ncbi:MAG: hexitol phosphatase HxpB [Chloroflexota bacterium]